MQIMANSSEEGKRKGLGWIDGEVKRFNKNIPNKKLYIPHIGWNHLTISEGEELFNDLNNPLFYFLHSYHLYQIMKKILFQQQIMDMNLYQELEMVIYGLHNFIRKKAMIGV